MFGYTELETKVNL